MRPTMILLLVSCLLLPFAAFAAEGSASMTNRIVHATPAHTAVRVDIDQPSLLQRIMQPVEGESISDGLGMILAIAGHGQPSAHVTSWDLGEVVSPTNLLQPSVVASNADELVWIGSPAVLHDLRIVRVGFRPLFRDGAGQLRTVNSVSVSVQTSGLGGLNEIDDPESFSSAFYPIYKAVVANLDEVYPEHAIRAPGRYLVLSTQNRYNSFTASVQWQSWLDLKKRKGYTMQIATVPNSLANTIRQTIQNAYDDQTQPDLEYVMIVGDDAEMNAFSSVNPEHAGEFAVSDNPFFTVAGGDSLPDVIGGRVSAQDGDQYVSYWSKAYRYEAEPYLEDRRWFQSGCFVAGNYADGSGTYPVTPVWNVEWSRQRLLENCFVNGDTFYYHGTIGDPPPGQYRGRIRADIDSGVCMVIYRGWGGSQGWQYPVFTNDDLDGHVGELNNGMKLPAFFSIVCGSGNYAFSGGPCLGEMVTTGVGSPFDPKGAITYLGASDLHTNTRHNNAILSGIVHSILHEDLRGAGALSIVGKLEGWRQFPREQGLDNIYAWYYVLHVFNLLGDPEIQLQICAPSEFSVAYPQNISLGTTHVPVTVTSGGNPVVGAVVTLRAPGSEVIYAERTDGTGRAMLPVNSTTAGNAQLTVWKSRFVTNLMDIPVQSQGYDPCVASVNWAGGFPNPGDQASFTLDIRNDGSSAITPSITIAQFDPRITVNTGTGSAPQIAPGSTGTSTAFSIALTGELTDGEYPELMLNIVDGANSTTRYVLIPVTAPDPVVASMTTFQDDTVFITPGATADISIDILNAGHQDATNLTAVVSSHDNGIVIEDNAASWAGIPVGATVGSQDVIRVRIPSDVTPGRQILLRFVFSHEGAVIARKQAFITVGGVTPNAPTGPDAYGYYAYEDIDGAYAAHPTYNWIELEGSGGEAHQVRDDSHFSMALPAPFTFYGQSCDSVWICSNGWLSFGYATLPEFRNFEIPSPIGPANMVCPFWDDLVIDRLWPNDDSVHTVWTRYDAAESRFIVQWKTFSRAGLNNSGQPNNAACTFEVILKYRPSTDGDILFQYQNIANVDYDNNFASVGIQDRYHLRGLGLTYAGFYVPSVDSLRANRAILFTTTPPDGYSDVPSEPNSELPRMFVLHAAYPNPFNPRTELRFELADAGQTTLKVYDILGKEVATLSDRFYTSGRYQVSFDAGNLPTGLYFARLTSGANTQVQKLMLVK